MNIDWAAIQNTMLIVAGILIIVDVIYIIAKAKNGEIREAAKTVAIILIAAIVLAIASHFKEFSEWLWDLLT